MIESRRHSLLDAAHEAATVGEDYPKARELYEEAARQGDIEGLYHLALMCRDGDGGPKDSERARRLLEDFVRQLREAANAGDPIAQRRLGQMLQYGDGTLKNELEAVRWITSAAESGMGEAQFHLSRLHAFGWCGLQSNEAAAELWLDRAAKAGYPEALYTKGVEHANRYVVSRDPDAFNAAKSWLEQAARAGFDEASSVLEQLLLRSRD